MGRPTRQDSASTIIVTFRITGEEKAQLDRIAAKRKTSISDVLRALIRREAARVEASPADGTEA